MDIIETVEKPGFFRISGKCVITGKEYTTDYMPYSGLAAYKNGGYLQDCFPDNTADDCEFLKTGISPEGWEQLFGSNE